jgi:hypothetical protein
MEKAKLFLFQMEVVETSFHSRLIGTLPSNQNLETKQNGAVEVVKYKNGGTSKVGGGHLAMSPMGHEVTDLQMCLSLCIPGKCVN